ncbi:MAG: PAS domain S-box protein, partial [Sediminibacterium sp.]
ALDNPGISFPGHAGRMRHKNGSWRWIEATVTNMLHDPSIAGIIDNFRDITDRKRTEEKLVYANRLYAFISQVNQYIVHAVKEEDIFKAACRIAIEFGKFKAAWIGILDKVNQKINLVEQAGMFTEDLPLFTNAYFEKNGPQYEVIRTGTYYVCNNIQKELVLEGWKTLAQKRGYHSCIVLPITTAGAIIGTLNLYASEEEFFNDEEIALLQEAARDISFALDLFESDKIKVLSDQKLASKKLHLSQAHAIAHLGSWDISFATGVAVWSDELCRIYGLSTEDNLQSYQSWVSFIHPDDIERVIKVTKEAEATNSNVSFFHRIIRRNGTIRHLHSHSQVQFNEQRMATGLYGVAQDITEIFESRESLHKSQSNLKAIIENTDATIYSLDREFRYITFNGLLHDNLQKLYGLDIKPGDNVYDFLEKLNPSEAREWEATYSKALEGEIVKFERNFSIGNYQSYFDFSIHPIWENKKVIGLSCFANDITEQKKAKNALRESEQRYRQIVETAQEGIWLVNEHNETVFVNNKLCNILGYNKAEMIGKHIYTFMDEEGIQLTERLMAKNIKGKNNKGDFKYISKSGKAIWTNVSANPIFDTNEVYTGALAMISDITEKRKLEELLDKATKLARLGNWEVDLNNNTMYWSAVTKQIYGVAADYIPDVETAIGFYKSGYNRDSLRSAIKNTIEGNTGWDLELEIVTAGGINCWVRTIGEAECIEGKCIRLYGSVQDIDAMKKSKETLKEKNEELKKLSAYLQHVREEERKHIAREVHDELGQLASALQIDIDWLDIKIGGSDEATANRISHAFNTIQVLIKTIRKIASGLRPSILDDFGLNAALQWYCNEFEQLNNIECRFVESFNDQDLELEIKTELFRMSQESLTNVMRHSKAKKVEVSITEDAANIYLTISDDGVGFDTNHRKNTLGLVGLRERALSIQGELKIQSEPGKGTRVSVIIPKK